MILVSILESHAILCQNFEKIYSIPVNGCTKKVYHETLEEIMHSAFLVLFVC